jgi:subfamily B ATP-binding cassette protein MsbA
MLTGGTTGWLGTFGPSLRGNRRTIVWAAFAVVVDVLFTLFRPWPLKVVIDRVLLHTSRPVRVPFLGRWLSGLPVAREALLYGACLTSLSIAIGTGLFTYCYTRAMGDVGRRFAFSLRRDLFAHMQRLSLRFHDRQRTGDLTSRLTSDISHIQEAIAHGLVLLATNSLLLLGMAALMFWLNWRFALVALSVAPVLFLIVYRYTQHIKRASRLARNSDGELASLAQETLTSIRTVQGLAREDAQDFRFEAHNRTSLAATLIGVRYQARVAPLVDALAGLGLALVMWHGARGVMAGQLSPGDVVVFFAYVTNLYSPMRALARLSFGLHKASVAAGRVAEVMAVRREVADAPGAVAAPAWRGAVQLDNVEFAYDAGHLVLRGINLGVSPGERIAVVGPTGAGKSTLVSLILRLYDPSSGRVLIDGEDIRRFRVQSVREQVSIVLQDALLMSGTIRENIAFARPTATEEEIVAAARVAGAAEFIGALPAGYDSIVGERGATLSGGQKQRIAIARAVLRDAPILILDEPTSGLDVQSEGALLDALDTAARGRTTFVIAHRLATLRLADRIIVMDHGEIVEDGRHTDLLARDGLYARLHRLSPHWAQVQVAASSQASQSRSRV